MKELDKLLHPISGLLRGITIRELENDKKVPTRGLEVLAIHRELVRLRRVRDYIDEQLKVAEEDLRMASTFSMGTALAKHRNLKAIKRIIDGIE